MGRYCSTDVDWLKWLSLQRDAVGATSTFSSWQRSSTRVTNIISVPHPDLKLEKIKMDKNTLFHPEFSVIDAPWILQNFLPTSCVLGDSQNGRFQGWLFQDAILQSDKNFIWFQLLPCRHKPSSYGGYTYPITFVMLKLHVIYQPWIFFQVQ